MEALYLSIAVLAGSYSAWFFAERLWLHTTGAHLTPYAPAALPWLAVAAVSMCLYAWHQHYWLRRMRIHNTKPAAVYPHWDRILGIDMLLVVLKALKENRLVEHWDGLFRTLGPTHWQLVTGQWMLFTNDPVILKAILSTQFEDWPIGGLRQKTTLLTLGPHAIFSVNGKEWQQGRALIRPTFVRNQIADLECQDRHVERLLEKIPGGGETFDLQKLLYLFTMDSATDFMLGHSTNMLVKPTPETLEFAQAFDYALLAASSRARQGLITYLVPDKRFDDSVKIIQRFVDRYVASALSDGGERVKERPYIFLNELLGSGASAEHIRDQILAIIIGGRDTSAGTLSSLFWTLARRPDVVAKIKNEIDVLKGQRPSWEDLKSFKYLNMTLKETLRLWPPVVTNMRVAARDVVLPQGGGQNGQHPLFVPRGTAVRWSLYSAHRREDYFGDDAREFRPERWESLRTSWEYLPFSGGPRTCIGQQFALTQMSYVVTRILQKYEVVEARDERPMVQNMSTTTNLLNGCWIAFRAG